MAQLQRFMDLSVDLKTLVIQHINRPADLCNVCLACKQLHEIAVRQLYHRITLDVGSSKDTRLGAFLHPRNIGLPHIREMNLQLADTPDKCNQLKQANFAVRMILELLPENILDKFSWSPWSPFSADNLVLLYKTQKRMKWMEAIAVDRVVLEELQRLPDLDQVFSNVHTLGLYPDSLEVLDFCHFLLVNTPKGKLKRVIFHVSLTEIDPPVPGQELHDTSVQPGIINNTIFRHMQPFAKCTPLALREITLEAVKLRHAADTYCKLIDFRSVKRIRVIGCSGADALFSVLSKSTMLPNRLEVLELKHNDNAENDGLEALNDFMSLVSGIKTLTIDLVFAKALPAIAGIVRHGKTLTKLNIHTNSGFDVEHVYDYASFSHICKHCPLLEQISVAFPPVSLLRSKNESFINFETCLGDLPHLATLNITSWPHSGRSSIKLSRKIYEHLLANLAQQGFERISKYAKEQGRTSKLAMVAFGSSDNVHDRQDSQHLIIFVKGKFVDPLGKVQSTAIQIGWGLSKYVDAGAKADVLDFALSRSTHPPARYTIDSDDSD